MEVIKLCQLLHFEIRFMRTVAFLVAITEEGMINNEYTERIKYL